MKYFTIASFSLVISIFRPTAFGLEQEISGKDSCGMFGGDWQIPNIWQINGTIEIIKNTFVKIDSSVGVQVSPSSTLKNLGTIDNFGTIQNHGIMDNRAGTMNNNRGTILNDGSIEDNGETIDNNFGLIVNKDSIDVGIYGTPNNDGIIRDSGDMTGVDQSHIKNIPLSLKQAHGGMQNDSIVCRGNLQSVIKNDGSTACVKKKTMPNLIERNLDVNFDLGDEPPMSPIWDHDWE